MTEAFVLFHLFVGLLMIADELPSIWKHLLKPIVWDLPVAILWDLPMALLEKLRVDPIVLVMLYYCLILWWLLS